MISVVIPMYNEESIAEESMRELSSYMSANFSDWEIVVSNDGSRDRTKEIMTALSQEIDGLRFVSYDDNRGKGSAIREGILATKGDTVIYTDCDLAYGTEIIKTIAEKLEADGSDIVIGSRNISNDGYAGYTFLRKLASKTYIKVICMAAGFSHSDSQCGIKCFKGDAARRIFSTCKINSFAFDLEALMTAEAMGYKVTEQAVKIINHRESTSKVHLVKDTMKMLRDIRQIKKRLKKQKF
ncbi:MAG: glycosyltransferase [Clostridia bacterium]|nr:glycosyltransferase [Clostridia bacterium]